MGFRLCVSQTGRCTDAREVGVEAAFDRGALAGGQSSEPTAETVVPVGEPAVPRRRVLTPLDLGRALTPLYLGRALTPLYLGRVLTPLYLGRVLSPLDTPLAMTPPDLTPRELTQPRGDRIPIPSGGSDSLTHPRCLTPPRCLSSPIDGSAPPSHSASAAAMRAARGRERAERPAAAVTREPLFSAPPLRWRPPLQGGWWRCQPRQHTHTK